MLQLHPQRSTVHAGRIIFTPDKVQSLIEVTRAWYPRIKEDEGMVQIVTVSPAGKKSRPSRNCFGFSDPSTFPIGAPVVAVFLFYNGSEEEGRANFKSFFEIGEHSHA